MSSESSYFTKDLNRKLRPQDNISLDVMDLDSSQEFKSGKNVSFPDILANIIKTPNW